MKILVTGAGGMIGRHVVQHLVDGGHEVHGLGRTVETPPYLSKKIRWHEADLMEDGATKRLIKEIKPEGLLHLAWTTEHGKFWKAPENMDWAGLSLRLLRYFVYEGGRRAVAAGSCAEYDWTQLGDGICLEEGTPVGSPFLYGIAKNAVRQCAQQFFKDTGGTASFAWGRVFFLFGEGENPRRLVPSVINSLLRGEVARVSSGTQIRDFMSSREAGRAFAQLLVSNVEGVVNIASGQPTALRSIIAALCREIGGEADYGAIPGQKGEPPILVADVTRLRDEVGFKPAESLQDGLSNTVKLWR
ncbi:nucleoside-diphosphate-sugar epimerase [Candidatus Omnitrophus magneticus]|uniref:Nucleoside-diphosphate-sugar epimerase n=1 Tax=Candidatus Omnitrophus magneticus TaxID=1609969 RepID=A0A0F0CUT8_9BACT|nr:nucleoside-diphosphate-sugar epimerase [Candidatus Omnitrophus magneticus]